MMAMKYLREEGLIWGYDFRGKRRHGRTGGRKKQRAKTTWSGIIYVCVVLFQGKVNKCLPLHDIG